RKYPGCKFIEMYSDLENTNNVVFIEEWDSKDDYKKYHAWRTETGVIAKIRSMLEGGKASSIEFLEKINV
ncbi:MAG: hypothetical protein GTO02_15290, partial [Candidatus Dadabacteria bacterium]|nr:hypothetical protein [Candidatus Dadabacteria bacterium]NIQ15705.1 hypothetical protein [Candidatus Dadabacteria bacterium]